ncbi:MAG: flippase-like domain-containing protein [Actinomycetota bacterium]|nr:flippase-like domain-containing protein [Actinomycetota bacterium]
MRDPASAGGPSSNAASGAGHIRRSIIIALAAAAVGLLVLLGPPDLSELAEVPELVANGHLGWLAAALLFELLSFAGYVALFRAVFVDDESRVGWRESYAITMAGLVASRVFASAGAGGVALTVWALRRLEIPARRVADRMVAFLMLLYAVYMACLVLVGLGLWTGLLAGPAPWALTLAPAVLGALAIAAGLALVRIPADLHRRLRGRARDVTPLRRTLARVGHAPAAAGRGARVAVSLLRRREPGLLGAPAWWGFDIAVLWATFHAFGEPPPIAVLVIAYFVGMFGNVVPAPGGVGGVEGGMIGALVAFGVGGGLAVVAVIAYRVFAFWLPTLPGALAYLQLRRDLPARSHPDRPEDAAHDAPPGDGRRSRPPRLPAATAALHVRRRVTRGRLAWLAGGATVGAAYLVGAFPDLPDAQEAVTALGEGLGPWTYAIVGGLALLETAALVGLVAPGEWSAIVGGAVAGEGTVRVVALIATVWACAAAGHGLSFVAGRRFGRGFLVRHGPRFGLGHERLSAVDRFFARHGAKAVFAGQFIGLFRAVMPFLAGSSGMPYRRFAVPSVAATGAWATAYTLLGYLFYRSLADVEGVLGMAAAAGIVLAALVAIAAWVRHRRVQSDPAEGGLPRAEPLPCA